MDIKSAGTENRSGNCYENTTTRSATAARSTVTTTTTASSTTVDNDVCKLTSNNRLTSVL